MISVPGSMKSVRPRGRRLLSVAALFIAGVQPIATGAPNAPGAPRPIGARIACAGGNFADHAAAMAEKMQRKPYTGDARAQIRNAGIWGFWKIHREVAGPDGAVIYPQKANRLDYEGELAIVLAKRGTDIEAKQ